MTGSVGSPGNESTPPPVTDATVNHPGSNNGQTVQPVPTDPHLAGLNPSRTSETPIRDRTTSRTEATPTPGLQPSQNASLQELETERTELLEKSGKSMAQLEEMRVAAIAIQALDKQRFPDNQPPRDLQISMKLSPDSESFSVVPPDDYFNALPEEKQAEMKALAVELLMKHCDTHFSSVDVEGTKRTLGQMKERLEKNGEEIGQKGGENNWRLQYQALEFRPAVVSVHKDDGIQARAEVPAEESIRPETPPPGDDLTLDDNSEEPPLDDHYEPEKVESVSELDLSDNVPSSVSDDEISSVSDDETSSISGVEATVNNQPISPPAGAAESEVINGVTVISGDITRLKDQWGIEVDAVTNAASEFLTEGSGVCGAIFNAAGSEALKKECTGKLCVPGEAIATNSHGLASQGVKKIIHAVGPDLRKAVNKERPLVAELKLSNAYVSALSEAERLGMHSIALPALSVGAYGYDEASAMKVAVKAISKYRRNHPNAPDVVFVLHHDGDANSQSTAQGIRLREYLSSALRESE